MTMRITASLIATIAAIVSLFVMPAVNLQGLNLFYPLLMAMLLFGAVRLAYGAAVAGGFIFELVSPQPFGVTMLSVWASLFIVHWLFRTKITNRSFLAFCALMTIGTAAIGISQVLLGFLGKTVSHSALTIQPTWIWIHQTALSIVWSVLLGMVIFFGARLSGQRYQTLTKHEF